MSGVVTNTRNITGVAQSEKEGELTQLAKIWAMFNFKGFE